MKYIKYYLIFVWIELIVLFAVGCSAPKERRGDWMEHMNYRQFTSEAPMRHWDRHNYYSLEELQQMWEGAYNRAIQDIPDAAERILRRNKAIARRNKAMAENDWEEVIKANEDIHKWSD